MASSGDVNSWIGIARETAGLTTGLLTQIQTSSAVNTHQSDSTAILIQVPGHSFLANPEIDLKAVLFQAKS